MITGLATQEELGSFKNELERLGSNLSFHVNSSLSKAHGIALIRGPQADADGNDLRIFQDEAGDAVSGTDVTKANFIRFIVNGVAYYAPCLYSDPGAQGATTGAIELTPVTNDAPGGVALITDYVTYEQQAAENTNALFLDHPKKTHQIAHIEMSVVFQDTVAPDGHVYANYRVRLQWANNVYEIPAHTRLGGPLQAVRGANLLTQVAKKYNAVSVSHQNPQTASLYLTLPTAGTLPYTVTYQINTAQPTFTRSPTKTAQCATDIWEDMLDTTPGWHDTGTFKNVDYDISVANTLKLKFHEGNNDSEGQCLVRVKFEQPGLDPVYTNYAFVRADDEDGSWIFGGPDSSVHPYLCIIAGSPAIN